ncbi:MAG: ATP-binding protein [Verrucomicrobiaceae bacterium]|nr:ATP-binding protein [Verrucomicrobiaceae bacterium]
MTFPASPFEPARLLGAICEVSPGTVKVTAPASAVPGGKSFFGQSLGTGQVGEFVVIQSGLSGILGRVTRVALAEKERLSVEPSLAQPDNLHPTALVQMLATLDIGRQVVVRGIATCPGLGDKVFSAPPSLLRWVAGNATGSDASDDLNLDLGWVANEQGVRVNAKPERLFGRHCAILGTTGGGKSFSLARLVEQCATHRCKVIVIDAVGEYRFDEAHTMRLALGRTDKAREQGNFTLVSMPYRFLTIPDLFALFQPSGKVQGPMLRRAIGSQKLRAAIENDFGDDLSSFIDSRGVVVKTGRLIAEFDAASAKYATALQSLEADFDVFALGDQILAECIFTPDKYKPDKFGIEDGNVTYCTALIHRINGIIHAPELACVFKPGTHPPLTTKLVEFFAPQNQQRVLHLSLRDLAFDFNAREVVANAIGRWLLRQAREDKFRIEYGPVVVFLDEAHHFLNKSMGDEDSKVQLDAFELIAKEGRKYWLTLCLATQQPRDIPSGVLSQMGTLLVHRLINDRDREVVERACGEIDRSAAAFLPTLGPGEAALIGVDFSIPLTVQMDKPRNEPKSQGPNYQEAWAKKDAPAEDDILF